MACSTCSSIPPQLTANTGRDEILPASTRALKRLGLDRSEDLWECPGCEAMYVWEDLSSWTGSGNNDEETLTRLPDAQASLVRRLLRRDDAASTDPDALADGLFALPPTVIDLVLPYVYHHHRALARSFLLRMVTELARRDYYAPNAYCLRDLLSGLVEQEPTDAQRVLSAIERTPHHEPHLLDQVAERCRRAIAGAS